ncbi:hypothetical protein VAG18_002891 [Escherichia coli]|nr:hypothetical protein [Escherichia coli]
MAKIKIELKTSLPSDVAERERLRKTIEELVDLQLQIKDLKEAIKDIVTVEKQDHSYSPKFIKSLVATEFDRRYEAEKRRAKIEEEVEHMTEADILFKRTVE